MMQEHPVDGVSTERVEGSIASTNLYDVPTANDTMGVQVASDMYTQAEMVKWGETKTPAGASQ